MDYKSTDGTREVAVSKNVILIDESRKGKGIAVRNAMEKMDSEYIIMMDADYTYSPSYIPDILHQLYSGSDVAIGYRCWKDKNSMSTINNIGNFLLSLLASVIYGYRVRDVCSGMWGFKLDALERFDLDSVGFTFESDLFVNAVRNKCRIGQTAIKYRARLGGSKAKLSIWDGFKIAWFLIRKGFGGM